MDVSKEEINNAITDKLDAACLIDLLEHVPDPLQIIDSLSGITKYFIIKLPIENSIFDNYIMKKRICWGRTE